jgi:hypothetical protein
MVLPAREQPPRYEPYGQPVVTTVASSALVGFLTTKIFTNINPIAGALFTGMFGVLNLLASKLNNIFARFLHSTDAEFIKNILCGALAFVLTNKMITVIPIEGIKFTFIPYIAAISLIAIGSFAVLSFAVYLLNRPGQPQVQPQPQAQPQAQRRWYNFL